MSIKTRDEITQEYKATNINNGEILVKNVSFKVDETKISENINFSIKDGEKVGIVGNIGSGKQHY